MSIRKAYTKEEEYKRRQIVKGQYLCRMRKNEQGMFEDEIRELPDGRKIKTVYPYTLQRAEKVEFRDMTLKEIEEHFSNLRADKQVPYDVLERKLREKEEELRVISEAKSKSLATLDEVKKIEKAQRGA